MYDYSRRLDLSQPWPANLVLKISKQFLVVFHKNSRWIFSIDAKTFSKSVRCYQSKRPIFKSLLNFCSDLAKKCAFFLKNTHVSNIRRVPCKTNIIMQFAPHLLHNYSLFSIYSQSKNGVSRRKNCYILLKMQQFFHHTTTKGKFWLARIQAYIGSWIPMYFCLRFWTPSAQAIWSIRLALQSIPYSFSVGKGVCHFLQTKKIPAGACPRGYHIRIE